MGFILQVAYHSFFLKSVFCIIPNNVHFNYHMQLVHWCKGNTFQEVSFAQKDKRQGEMVFLESAVTQRIFVPFRAFRGYSASFLSRMLENPLTRIKTATLTSFLVSARRELDFHTFRLLDYS